MTSGAPPLMDPGPGVTSLLERLGYTDDLLRFDYPVWVDAAVSRLPVVGFARQRPQDMTTATIVGARSSNGNVEQLFAAARALAAPALLLSRANQVEVWSVPSDPGTERRVNAAPEDDIGRLAGLYRPALGPDSLFAAKSAQRQLPLFPVDVNLLATARRGVSDQLTKRVEEAVILATIPLSPDKHIQREQLITASQLVVGTLAALVIRDKFGLRATGFDLFDQARQRFPNYFDSLEPTLQSIGMPLSEILDVLGNGINYEALDPRIVSLVYEEAIVDQSERLKSGIFYTPPELATRILQHIPIEELAPEDRVILDPACGSGTLLLAAHDRLQALTPTQWERDDKHMYVTKHLHGLDQDQFAVDIARLALLLHALPEGNNWDVRRSDTLTTELDPDQRPKVIVSNPPWRDIRSIGGRRHQVADDFLRWALEALRPNGFFAIVLPSPWLTSSTSGPLRAFVQERATVFEVWRLPDDTFPSARIAPCVLFGQVGRRVARPWIFRRVLRSGSRETFYRTGVADETYLGIEPEAARVGTYLRGPLDEAASKLKAFPTLGSIATVQNGPVPEPPVSERGGTGNFLWLKNGRNVRPFGLIDRTALRRVRFPEEFHRAGKHDGSVFLRPKLVISADRSPANPWRLKVGLDMTGVIPRDSLHMVIPNQTGPRTLDALLAILGSAFAAAWVDSYEAKLAIEARLIREMPVPPPGPAWTELAEAGRRMVDAADSPPLLVVRARELDDVVFRAYGLPERARRSIASHFAGFVAPEGSVRYPDHGTAAVVETKGVHTFGAVLDVESRGRLRLWVPGATPDEGLVQPVPRRFMGWHCVEGATFDIDIDEYLADARYIFQRRSYQDFQEEGSPHPTYEVKLDDIAWPSGPSDPSDPEVSDRT
jgi:SAM-dependent methyltransferase